MNENPFILFGAFICVCLLIRWWLPPGAYPAGSLETYRIELAADRKFGFAGGYGLL